MASPKVTVIGIVVPAPYAPLGWVVPTAVTFRGVVSITICAFARPSAPVAGSVSVAALPAKSWIVPPLSVSELVAA